MHTSLNGLVAPLHEEKELVYLHVQRERSFPGRGCRPGDGEVDPVAVVGSQRLHVWAEVVRAQALT